MRTFWSPSIFWTGDALFIHFPFFCGNQALATRRRAPQTLPLFSMDRTFSSCFTQRPMEWSVRLFHPKRQGPLISETRPFDCSIVASRNTIAVFRFKSDDQRTEKNDLPLTPKIEPIGKRTESVRILSTRRYGSECSTN